VLLASASHRGLSWRFALDLARQGPRCFGQVLRTLSMYPLVSTPALARELLLSAGIAEEQLLAYQARPQDESLRA